MSRHPAGPSRHRSGFSMIELIAVIVILAVLSGAAVASLATLGDRQSRLALRGIVNDIAYAREYAMARAVTVWVVFDPDSDRYELRLNDPATPGYEHAPVMTDSLTGQPMACDLRSVHGAEVDLTEAAFAGGSVLGFDPLGRPLGADGTELVATGGSIAVNSAYTAIIHADTGFATVTGE